MIWAVINLQETGARKVASFGEAADLIPVRAAFGGLARGRSRNGALGVHECRLCRR
ncbi:hypothetical protein PHYC_01619 [Phycisphaerales bacterium]|nr:hypothetical protein PHYC_01619 [Phycisphaerales bacterium]